MNKLFFFLFSILSFTNSDKEKVEIWIDKDSEYILITEGFKSCQSCYNVIYQELSSHNRLNSIPIYWIGTYKESIISRKSNYQYFKNLIKSKEDILFLYDDTSNSFLNRYEIDISPSLILIKGNELRTIHYKDLFKENNISDNAVKQIARFFEKE